MASTLQTLHTPPPAAFHNNFAPGFNLINFYAIEVLESLGFIDPPEEKIQAAMDILATAEWTSDSRLKALQNHLPKTQSLVLFESSRLFSIAHFVMLSNVGFDIQHHVQKHPAIVSNIPRDAVIFSRHTTPGQGHLILIESPYQPIAKTLEIPLSFRSLVHALEIIQPARRSVCSY